NEQGKILFLLFSLASHALFAEQFAYLITFTNKQGTRPKSDSALFLSTRSLQRRAQAGVVFDTTDLPITQAYVDSVLQQTNGKIHGKSKWLNACVILIRDSSLIHNIDRFAFVSSYRLVGYYAADLHLPLHTTSDKSKANIAQKLTAFDAAYYYNTWLQTRLLNGDAIHRTGYKGTNKLIAVLDGGFDATDLHRGFDSMRRSGGIKEVYNFVLDTSYVYSYDIHGTQALSTIAANVPDTFVGSAPQASFALYITEDWFTEQPIELFNMAVAMERADSLGADIISSSLGYNTFDNPSDDLNFNRDCDGKSTIAARAVNMATQKGMLFIASAGNEGENVWRKVLTPGDADSALTVGSVNVAGLNPASSGRGPNAAGHTKPDVCALGNLASVFSREGYMQRDGTSFAVPQIAGWAACLWQAAPNATAFQIKQAMRACASKFSSPQDQLGYGIPDLKCAYKYLVKDTIPNVDTPTNAAWIYINPVPANTLLYINLNKDTAPQTVKLIIYSDAGQKMAEQMVSSQTTAIVNISIPVGSFAPGVYFLHAVSPVRNDVIKWIKN
ncbi:MAG: hypothetical protein EBX41_05230, partial [Chitinophagia bacterium]|nr:hypothetical protein [Chitinophagia bacterium]